jgi:hypothetical protein
MDEHTEIFIRKLHRFSQIKSKLICEICERFSAKEYAQTILDNEKSRFSIQNMNRGGSQISVQTKSVVFYYASGECPLRYE